MRDQEALRIDRAPASPNAAVPLSTGRSVFRFSPTQRHELLTRVTENPILEPTKRWWESVAVFNPGAVEDTNGVIHLLYRAIGTDRVSRLGYARTRNGTTIDERSPEPVLEPDVDDEYDDRGIEDPRITFLDNRYYITYTAVSEYRSGRARTGDTSPRGPDRIRVGYAWTTDFQTYTRGGVLLPDMDNKDVVLFPERIGGHYVVLHRLPPDMWIAFSSDLRSWSEHRVLLRTRPGLWDERKLGAGPPPIRISEGWLLLYHGSDHHNVYRTGFVLLDEKDPSVVRGRSPFFALEPRMPYERGGTDVDKVVFPTGLVRRGDELLVYYGGADRVVGAARGSLKDVLASLR